MAPSTDEQDADFNLHGSPASNMSNNQVGPYVRIRHYFHQRVDQDFGQDEFSDLKALL